MKSYSYSQKVKNIAIEKLWATWTNVNQWQTWQDDLDFAKLEGEFKEGKSFILKPKGGPQVNIQLQKVIPNQQFIDLTRFPLARMYGNHEFIQCENGDIEIKTTMSIEGPLAFLWHRLVMAGIVEKLGSQTDSLIRKSMES